MDAGSGVRVDMAGVLLDSGAPADGAGTFAVSDGGVLDNIPLRRALDAVAEAPAGGPTDRYLMYLQPGVPSVPKAWDGRSTEHRETAFSVLRGALSSRMPAENIIGDLVELDSYNARVGQAVALRRSTFAAITDPETLRATAARTWDSYRVLRAEEDRRSVMALLDDPLATLGEDPFPHGVAGQHVPDACWRSPLDHTSRRPFSGNDLPSRDRLASVLHAAFLDRLAPEWSTQDGDLVWRVGVRPVLRVTQLLLEWAQHLESRGATDAGSCKAELYRVATFLRVAVDRPRQLGWVTVAATHAAAGRRSGTEEALVRTTLTALRRLVELPAEEVGRMVGALQDDSAAGLTAVVAARVRALDDLADGWHVPPDGPEISGRVSSGADGAAGLDPGQADVRVAVVDDLLVPVARRLAALSAGLDPAGGADASADLRHDPGWYLDRALTGTEVGSGDLAALEVVAFLEFATGLPARRQVRLKRISSQSEVPVAPYLTTLLAAAHEQGKWWEPGVEATAAQMGIHVDLKLAGDAVANFSAFLDSRWRLNDWMWGRLDAVPTLLELLVTPGSLRSWLSGRPDRVGAVAELVLGPEGADDDGLRAFLLEHVWTAETKAAVAAELDALGTTARAGESPAAVAATRRALTAARQWEVLATEPAVTGGRDTRRDPGWPGPALVEAVGAYGVGAETFGDDRVRWAVRRRLARILWTAGRVAEYNVVEHAPRPPAGRAVRRVQPAPDGLRSRVGVRREDSAVPAPAASGLRWGRRARWVVQAASWPVAFRMTRRAADRSRAAASQ